MNLQSDDARYFLRLVGVHDESERAKVAMLCAASCWIDGLEFRHQREYMRPKAHELYKDHLRSEGYGSMILIFILSAAAYAAVEWAVERLLDWLYPEKGRDWPDPMRASMLKRYRHGW